MGHFHCVTQQLCITTHKNYENSTLQFFQAPSLQFLSLSPIFSEVTVWVHNSYNDEDVLKVRTDWRGENGSLPGS